MSNYNDYNDFLNDISQDEEWKEIEQYTNIISKIIIARNEKNMSQQELADKIGMKQSAIARIENCKIKPKIDTLIKIFNALDLDIVVEKKINFDETKSVIEASERFECKKPYLNINMVAEVAG